MRYGTRIFLLALVSIAILCAAPWVGAKALSWQDVMVAGADDMAKVIFWQIRLPRVLLAWLAGGALAIAGMAFQAMFRNPLATPFTLGVSSGASFGASLAIRSGVATLATISGGAFLGALAAIGLVYGLARSKRGLPTSTMLLAGVAVNFLFSSLILLIQFTGDFAETIQVLRWTMGSLQIVGMDSVLTVGVVAVALVVLLGWLSRELDLLTVGEDIATTRGVDVRRVKAFLFFGISLTVAVVVSTCGPIGFVGLIAPHSCRLLVGSLHRYLLPATFLFGGGLLVACDSVGRTVMVPAELPVGIFTALLGAPFFLFLLLRGDAERRTL